MQKLFKTLLIEAGLATGLAPLLLSAANCNNTERYIYNDIKKPQLKNHAFQFGGIPLITAYYGNPSGLTPKEYGILYGNGKSRKVKTNRLLIAKRVKARH